MFQSHFILASGWVFFCAFHSIFASSKFKQAAKKWMGTHYKFYRLCYTVFSSISFFAVLVYLLLIPSYKFFKPNEVTIITGVVVSLSGLIVMGICIVKYFMQLSGLRELFENKMSDELMTSGIHGLVRHPLYTGTFIFTWGLFILFPSISTLISDVIITVYTLIGLHFEEKKLQNQFGEKYLQYMRNVPMLIPKLGDT
jgi:protein-S-isoprenylcysteine O-methyltransferase Ste14